MFTISIYIFPGEISAIQVKYIIYYIVNDRPRQKGKVLSCWLYWLESWTNVTVFC